jgi:hypothetical protein
MHAIAYVSIRQHTSAYVGTEPAEERCVPVKKVKQVKQVKQMRTCDARDISLAHRNKNATHLLK